MKETLKREKIKHTVSGSNSIIFKLNVKDKSLEELVRLYEKLKATGVKFDTLNDLDGSFLSIRISKEDYE